MGVPPIDNVDPSGRIGADVVTPDVLGHEDTRLRDLVIP